MDKELDAFPWLDVKNLHWDWEDANDVRSHIKTLEAYADEIDERRRYTNLQIAVARKVLREKYGKDR